MTSEQCDMKFEKKKNEHEKGDQDEPQEMEMRYSLLLFSLQ